MIAKKVRLASKTRHGALGAHKKNVQFQKNRSNEAKNRGIMMRRFSWIMCGLIAVILGVGLLLNYGQAPTLPESRHYGKAAIGGAFEAVDHLGQPFSQDNLQGKYSLVYFGFTYCPDICPTSLLVIAETLDSLPESMTERILPVFITIDPKRDTVEMMKQYVSNFHPKLVGVTGTPEQMAAVAKAYKVYFNQMPAEDGSDNYLVDHSGFLYLMGPDGQYLTHFPHNVSMQTLAEKLRSHMLGS
jgi:cytochrome oxidase Cu insertion factor (SCO1/SenC/PrrC family)